jgi:hypothetical protein
VRASGTLSDGEGAQQDSTVLLSTFATLRVNSAKHLDAHPEMRPDNDAGGLDIHAVNAARAASYAQTACKEASTATQSVRT